MNILDENVAESQRELLLKKRIHAKKISVDLGSKGMDDRDIVPLLHGLNQATLFTQDRGWFRAALCHANYCVVLLDVDEDDCAEYVRRLLRHPEFDTKAKRMGRVVRASPDGLTVFNKNSKGPMSLDWPSN